MTQGPPDSNRPRPVHRDFAGREVTRPGPHVDDLDATAEDGAPDSGTFRRELTPVESAHDVRLARVEAATTRIEMALAQGHDLPDTEWARRHDVTVAGLADRVAVCEREREARGKWTVVIKWAKGIGSGGVLAALLWAITALGDRGKAQRDAEIQRETVRRLVDDVTRLREAWIADHALLEQHLRSYHP